MVYSFMLKTLFVHDSSFTSVNFYGSAARSVFYAEQPAAEPVIQVSGGLLMCSASVSVNFCVDVAAVYTVTDSSVCGLFLCQSPAAEKIMDLPVIGTVGINKNFSEWFNIFRQIVIFTAH